MSLKGQEMADIDCIKVDKLQIEAFDNDLVSCWIGDSHDCTELEFYTAYAATRQRLDALANVENLYLHETEQD